MSEHEESESKAPHVSLEEWIAGILQQRPGELRRKYAYSYRASDVLDALEQWAAPSDISPEAWRALHSVPDEVLHALHQHLRNRASEDRIWDVVLWALDRSLPPAVAHDLLDRHVAVEPLLHSHQEDEVQWRMAREHGAEALQTLAIEYYTRSERSLAEFQALLREFRGDEWMLRSLECSVASSPEKKAAFEAVAESPEAPEGFRRFRAYLRLRESYADPDVTAETFRDQIAGVEDDDDLLQYLNRKTPSSRGKEEVVRCLVEARTRSPEFRQTYNRGRFMRYYTQDRYSVDEFRAVLSEMLDDKEILRQLDMPTPQPAAKEDVYLEALVRHPRDRDLRRILDLHRRRQRAADPDLGEEEMRALYATGECRILEVLAGNPCMPDGLLREMAEQREHAGARNIRKQAQRMLKIRENAARREEAARQRAERRKAEDEQGRWQTNQPITSSG